MIVAVLFSMMMCGVSMSLGLVGFLVWRRSVEKIPPEVTPTTETTEETEETPGTVVLEDGELRTISRSGTYYSHDFDKSRPKGKMCNAASTTTSSGAAKFKFTKSGGSGNYWTVATDCDGDGNYTSYLTGEADVISAKTDDLNKQRWTINCTTSGCSFKNKASGKYLAGSVGKKATFTTNPVYYTI
jgi:hypothetical protein